MMSFFCRLAYAILLALPLTTAAQNAAPTFSAEKLDQLTASIALYPDSLLAQVLMASTYPADVALAFEWAKANKGISGDAAVEKVKDEPWDPSVQSLVAFPQVLASMGEGPEWVQTLGDAFLAQPADVMNSVQRLRGQAKAAGNLKSDQNQIIATEPAPPPEPNVIVQQPVTQIITIAPANPQVVFVPTFNPAFVYGPWLWPSYPPMFFPPAPFWGFGTAVGAGIAWGVGIGVSNALWGGMNWGRGDVNINVNNFNNINVNRNRINNSGGNRQNWSHNSQNRRGTPYRDAGTRQRFENRVGGADGRQQYRGRDNASRDAQRQAAQNKLAERAPGANLSGTARERAQNVDRSQLQNRAQNVDRSQLQNRAQNVDRSQLQNRSPNMDRNELQNRAQNVDRSQLQNRAQGMDRSQMQDRARNIDRGAGGRDNALRGAGGAQGNRDFDRGRASQAAQSRDFNRGGGGMSRPSGGGGGGMSRPSGGGGASRPSGGGGGRPGGGGGGGRGNR